MEIIFPFIFLILLIFVAWKIARYFLRIFVTGVQGTYEHREQIISGAGFVSQKLSCFLRWIGKFGKIISRYATIESKFSQVRKLDFNVNQDREKLREFLELYQRDIRLHDETHPAIIKLHARERELVKFEHDLGAKNVLSYPLPEIIHALTLKLDNISEKDLLTQCHGDLLKIAIAVQAGCEENGLVTPQAGRNVADYIEEVDATETVIDLYTQKISRVRKDPNLCEEEKVTKITYLQRLLANQMGRLENA
ncbi:hypothetical protein GCM10011332_32350 [Terasakiella brassicae]|uniref:Uncharacterized protein n=1 Tax=Terasakiella brassicae TaxID=1634917 RepID=A0A917C8L0_9PROT|nr:hypothetical protein [Terasakiella brassicae]GGF75885.1 hypothetical protein GCM10011332_32350 [Terasakiella brassicae]